MPKGCIPFGQDRPSGISKSGVRCGSKCKVDPNMHEGKNEYKVPTSNSPPKGGSTVIPTQAGTVTQVTHKKKPVVNQWMNDHNPKPTAKDAVNRAIQKHKEAKAAAAARKKHGSGHKEARESAKVTDEAEDFIDTHQADAEEPVGIDGTGYMTQKALNTAFIKWVETHPHQANEYAVVSNKVAADY